MNNYLLCQRAEMELIIDLFMIVPEDPEAQEVE